MKSSQKDILLKFGLNFKPKTKRARIFVNPRLS